jgi:acetolactate synthase-1/2/3 large subunit
MQSLATEIAKATRPIIVAGLGVNRRGCETQLKALVEALRAPVLCAVSAKGTLSDTHPLCGGTFMGSEDRHALLDRSDLIVTVGLDVVELFEPGNWPYAQPVLNIDSVPHLDGLFHPAQEFVGDIGMALEALHALVSPCTGWDPGDIAACRQRRPAVTASSSDRVLPPVALHIMREVLPDHTILTADAGQHKVAASRQWTCYEPLSYLTSSGLGTMGVAIPIAITAKLLRPQQPVVALTGDGGFLMRVSELETAQREGTPIVVVIFNDGYLNLIKMKQERQGYAVLGSQFAPVDFVRVSEGFGFRAASVRTDASFRQVLSGAIRSGEPWVIDVQIDPEGY